MIELPTSPAPNSATPTLLDFGFVQRPALGAAALRIDRAGNRHQVEFGFPPMSAEVARVFVSRLQQAKSEGLRIAFPLLGVSQGSPGSPTVRGSGAGGTALPLEGLTPGYVAKEGYWLTVIDADEVHYLHCLAATATADAAGEADLVVTPPLRHFPGAGDAVLLARPLVEGLVTSEISHPREPNRLVRLSFTLEEAA